MLTIHRTLFCSAVLLSGTMACSQARNAQQTPPVFQAGAAAQTPALRAAIWDDGQAEVALYDTNVERYGSMRKGDAVLITVKESFDADLLVKADGVNAPKHRLSVMKLNHISTFLTGVYTYRMMSSSYLTRKTAQPVKLATGSQEWCGLTSKVLTMSGPVATLTAESYFGDEGSRVIETKFTDTTVLADSLPLWLRTLDFNNRSRQTITVYTDQLSNRALEPTLDKATLVIGEVQKLDVPAGSFEAHPITLTRNAQKDVYWIDNHSPHALVRWDRADGGHYALRVLIRASYWKMHDPEHVGAIDPRDKRGPLPQ